MPATAARLAKAPIPERAPESILESALELGPSAEPRPLADLALPPPPSFRTAESVFDSSTKKLPSKKARLDLGMVAGILIALLTVAAGIALSGTTLRYFFQPVGALIVFGGTFGVTLITTPRDLLAHTGRRIVGLLRPTRIDRQALMEEILEYVRLARKKGMLGIEPIVQYACHPLLAQMLTLAVDGSKREQIQTILETKVRLRERQGEADAKVLEVAGGFAPTIGVLGTVVGLIDVLRQFSNMNSVVLGIGTAFVSTIYGLGLANLVLLPAAQRIRASVAEQFETEEMIIQAGLCMLDGTHPSLIREQISCYLRGQS